jgi:hypothetical protein
VNQLLKSVVRETCTLRSVGAGTGDRPGHPVGIGHTDVPTALVNPSIIEYPVELTTGILPPKLFHRGTQWSIRHSNQSTLRVVHL